jgi:hypothetical protein
MRFFVGFYQGYENLEPVSIRRAFFRAPQTLNFMESSLVVSSSLKSA